MIAPKSKLLAGSNGKWVPADIKVMGYGRNAYFRIVTDAGVIDLYGPKDRLVYGLRAAADLLDGREPSPMVTDRSSGQQNGVTNLETESAGSQLLDVTKLSPADVADYFRQSDDLHQHAADIEQLYADEIASDQASRDVEKVLIHCNPADLIDDDGGVKWGAQTAVAAVLGVTNAGSHRPRIQAVLATLSRRMNSTTTATKPQNARKSA